jgi:glucose/arabinose dehydrogenase
MKQTVTTTKVLAWLVLVGIVLSASFALAQPGTKVIQVPEGFQIEKVVDGLTYPTSITWDDEGNMYVAEAGGAFLEQPAPSRILRIQNGQATEVINLSDKGVRASVVGITWHDGQFYFTHRDRQDRAGAVSRVTLDGEVTQLFSGFIDSQSDHQLNDIKVGPDGRMYFTSGTATNSGVNGLDDGGWVLESPNLRPTPCADIVLTGQNFQTPNYLTPNNQSDTTLTGAYVTFGTKTQPGQVIKGRNKCGGSILSFDPKDPEGTLKPYAWGLRNVIGLAWNKSTGEMYTTVNGYDVRGSRPVQDEYDPTYRVREGEWYGWPDFSAAFEPLTDLKFDVPDSLQASIFVNGKMLPGKKRIGFLIDHEASGLDAPDKSLIAGLHQWQSSPSLLDVAPDSWGDMAGNIFVAEWGDLSPQTNPLRDKPSGNRVSVIDSETGLVEPFIQNIKPGPASALGAQGKGIERPFDVKFGPDGAMYIVDYGVVRINPVRLARGKAFFEWPPKTGIIWKVTRTEK